MTTGVLTRLRERLTGDAGFTLPEIMIGMMGSMIVAFAGFTAVETANRVQTKTTMRVEAANRGRTGMEQITRGIRAQQCLEQASTGGGTEKVPAMVWASGTGMEFYSSVAEYRADKLQPIERRRIEWITRPDDQIKLDNGAAAPTGDIVETVWRAREDRPPYSFPARTAPTSTRLLAESVEAVTGQPIFKYFGYEPGAPVGRPSNTPFDLTNTTATTYNPGRLPSVTAEDLRRVVLVEIRFAARSRATRTANTTPVPFFNRVAVRTADPTDPSRSPLCL